MKISLYYWEYGSDWKPLDNITHHLEFSDFRIVTANTYYDHSDNDDPIKSYIKVSPAYILEVGRANSHELYVKPSEIKRSRGRSDMVYELAETETVNSFVGYNLISKINIRLDPYYDIYEVDYGEHHPISVMAQIGGLLSFFKIIFDILITPIMKNVYLVEMINSYNIKRIEKYKTKSLQINMKTGFSQNSKVKEE